MSNIYELFTMVQENAWDFQKLDIRPPTGSQPIPFYIMSKDTWEEIIWQDNKICEQSGQVCERCGSVPGSDQEDCLAGKEIIGGGLESHIFMFKPSNYEIKLEWIDNSDYMGAYLYHNSE